MKKKIILLIIIMSTIFTACGDSGYIDTVKRIRFEEKVFNATTIQGIAKGFIAEFYPSVKSEDIDWILSLLIY